MNVTLQLPDHLVRSARDLALDENTSLSNLVRDLLSKKLDERTPPEATAGSWIDAFIGEAGDELLERDFPLAGRKTSPFYLNLDHLPASDRPAELYDEATADYDLPLSPRSEDVSRPVQFP